MVLTPESKFSGQINEFINGETELNAETINAFLQDLLNKTQYCKTNIEALQPHLNIQNSAASTEEVPAYDPSALKAFVDASQANFDPVLGQIKFPADKQVVTDANGRLQFIDKDGGGGATPTPSSGIMGAVYLSEAPAYASTNFSKSITAPNESFDSFLGNGLWIPQTFTNGVEHGDQIITMYKYLDPGDFTIKDSAPPDNNGLFPPGRLPSGFILKKGTYVLDAVLPVQFASHGQARLAAHPRALTDNDDATVSVAMYGTNAWTHRLKMRRPDLSNVIEDFVSSCSHLHSIVTEDFFGTNDEIYVTFDGMFNGVNNTSENRTAPANGIDATTTFIDLIFGAGLGEALTPPLTGNEEPGTLRGRNSFKELRLLKIG